MRDNDRRQHGRQDDAYPDPGSVAYRSPSPAEVQRAVDWLRRLLRRGPIWQREVGYFAEGAGITPSLLQRACRALNVIATNYNDENSAAQYKLWFWSLPKQHSLFDDNNGEPD
jgi:hypothetical protein